MKKNRFVRRAMLSLLGVWLIGLAAPLPARAGDKEFGLLVHYVESHYHARRSHRFLLGFACFAANLAARPEGVRGMKLALWENGSLTAAGANRVDSDDFPDVVRAGLQDGWQPMVSVWSRRNNERTVVFAKPEGNDMKLLVATAEEHEAVVVEMRINPDRLSKCIDGWTHEGEKNRRHDDAQQLPPAERQDKNDAAASDSL